jgi:hypothetical protein
MQEQAEFKPRNYQLPLLDYMDTGGCQGKRAFCLWHRRSGKDLTLWHYIINRAIRDVGIYYYLLPTFVQAKRRDDKKQKRF